ncbi:MAG TPA: hypothetical protein DCQ77_03655 [Betaproteobacteria bacterium]|nr:hypothetical protein [Betaproteobacteria bacterium]
MLPPDQMKTPSGGAGGVKGNKAGSLRTKHAMHGAALIKRLIVAAAIRGLLPASWATWLLHSLRLRGA